ncbi:MAG: T9SS type A sorting domain-containing protein, partial [bacterium]
VDIWVRGQDASPSKSPSNWGSAESTTIEILNTKQYTGVKLAAFTADAHSGFVTLNWKTQLEDNNAYFIVEKATDSEFKEVGRVNASGDRTYSFTDENVFGGEEYFYRLTDVSLSGEKVSHPAIKVLANGKPRPTVFSLARNFPNPFTGNTVIEYSIPTETNVKLAIYDVTGKEVRTLVNDMQGVNYYRTAWNGRDNNGNAVASGVYFYKLTAGEFNKSMKMMYLK